MMIQLRSEENKILYELEKSEMFPDYRSVLKEAIAYHIDLSGLCVESENIDNLVWYGNNMDSMVFRNCTVRRNEFSGCTGQILRFVNCDLTGSKMQRSNFTRCYITECNLSRLRYRNSFLVEGYIDNCNCIDATFFGSTLSSTCFYHCDISETVFNCCHLDNMKFIHQLPGKQWINNTYFIRCTMGACEMNYLDDISVLYFWDSDIRQIKFQEDQIITEVINNNSKVIYAVDSDVVWWKPYSWDDDEKRIFRGTLKELEDEVNNDFPTTDLYPSMMDYEVAYELINVCKYLRLWKENG